MGVDRLKSFSSLFLHEFLRQTRHQTRSPGASPRGSRTMSGPLPAGCADPTRSTVRRPVFAGPLAPAHPPQTKRKSARKPVCLHMGSRETGPTRTRSPRITNTQNPFLVYHPDGGRSSAGRACGLLGIAPDHGGRWPTLARRRRRAEGRRIDRSFSPRSSSGHSPAGPFGATAGPSSAVPGPRRRPASRY